MIAGVDGCKGGWLVALASAWPCPAPPQFVLCPNFNAVLEVSAGCAAVAVDMPIGFSRGEEERACDLEARKLLTTKYNATSRVFRVPPRSALDAQTWLEFQKLTRDIAQKGASKQVWAIAPRLREVDAALSPTLQHRVVEAHPELAFTHLARHVLSSKHTACGLGERVAVLADASPNILPALAGIPAGPALDDALDALALLATAAHVAQAGVEAAPDLARRVPALPFQDIPRDARGLRMEIWY